MNSANVCPRCGTDEIAGPDGTMKHLCPDLWHTREVNAGDVMIEEGGFAWVIESVTDAEAE